MWCSTLVQTQDGGVTHHVLLLLTVPTVLHVTINSSSFSCFRATVGLAYAALLDVSFLLSVCV